MTFEPPPTNSIKQFPAIQATNYPLPFLLKGVDDPDSAWNLVEVKPVATMMPTPDKSAHHPPMTTVTFSDTSVRWFHSDVDQVLIAPVTRRLGGDRQFLSEVGDAQGFQVLPDGNGKVRFHKGGYDVDVYFRGDDAIHASRLQVNQQMGEPIIGRSAARAAFHWLTTPLQPRRV